MPLREKSPLQKTGGGQQSGPQQSSFKQGRDICGPAVPALDPALGHKGIRTELRPVKPQSHGQNPADAARCGPQPDACSHGLPGVPVGKTNSGAGVRSANLPAQIFLLHQHADGLKERLLRTEGKHPAGNDGLFHTPPSLFRDCCSRTSHREKNGTTRTSAMYRAINSPTLPAIMAKSVTLGK